MAEAKIAECAGAAPSALIDGAPGSAVPVDDRGLAYADGVFRTLSVERGTPIAWRDHCQRLAYDCQRLGLIMPAPSVLRADIAQLFSADDSGVAKISVTRAGAGRGYAPSPASTSRRIVQAFPSPAHATGANAPLALDVSSLALAVQPALAGVKHLARLEQVLARAECDALGVRDALMCDTAGRLIATTMRNILAVDSGGHWRTPRLTRAGVAGATRARLLRTRAECGEPVRRIDMTLAECARLRGAIAVNSVGGVVPIERMGAYRLAASEAMARAARDHLAATR